tara:strand:+ start:4609 stop:5442 length:834 start_codon:yes stop_codon:yes gene_type:complete
LKNLIWLASYPKSGNTWLRAFLSNLTYETNEPVNINKMTPKYRANDKMLIEKFTNLEPSELTESELFNLRPMVYTELSKVSPNYPFIKIHDAYQQTAKGDFIIPSAHTHAVIYLVRNPIDVVGSLAHHQNKSYDETIKFMADDKATINQSSSYYHRLAPEVLLSWSNHLKSWINSGLNLLPIKYEDMHHKPLGTFTKIVEFLGFDYSESQIKKAIAFSDFKVLKNQEQQTGFIDKNMNSPNFFRKGQVNSGRKELSQKQIDEVKRNHFTMMKQMGYL